jgi:SAM-dependent methyltransferase
MYRWEPQKCPVCEVPPTKFIGRRGGTAHRQNLGVECRIWKCKCGMIFPNPMPVPLDLNQHYDEPDEYFVHHDTEQKNIRSEWILNCAEAFISRGRLLDIGAGRGETLRAARDLSWDAVGIEPSTKFARHAREYSGAEVYESLEGRFPSESFDFVVLAGVLEHLYNPDETIREISRILKPGGVLFLDAPNESGLYFHLGNLYLKLRGRDWVVNLAPTFSPFHVFGFSPSSLRKLLSKHDLRIVQSRVYGGESYVPNAGLLGFVEQQCARAVSALSNYGNLGTYLEAWAVKERGTS